MFVPTDTLCPFHPSQQQHHSLENGSADVGAAESTHRRRWESIHRARNPCSSFQARSGVFTLTHQALKPPKSCTTTAGETQPGGIEQVVLWFKLVPWAYRSPEFDSYHDPSAVAPSTPPEDRPQHTLPHLNSSKGDGLGKKPAAQA